MWLIEDSWPWWLGALALGAVPIGFGLFERRTLGVSGSVARVLDAIEDPEIERARDAAAANQDDFAAAMREATLAAFGEAAVAEAEAAPSPVDDRRGVPAPAPWTAHLVFLAMLVVGGVVGAALSGDLELGRGVGPTLAGWFGDGAGPSVALAIGGVLVGFGTRMSGGCTSGHGLVGCARLYPASLLATAGFFGTAIVVSLVLDQVLA